MFFFVRIQDLLFNNHQSMALLVCQSTLLLFSRQLLWLKSNKNSSCSCYKLKNRLSFICSTFSSSGKLSKMFFKCLIKMSPNFGSWENLWNFLNFAIAIFFSLVTKMSFQHFSLSFSISKQANGGDVLFPGLNGHFFGVGMGGSWWGCGGVSDNEMSAWSTL